MPESNGASRLDRLEQVVSSLIEHAAVADQRLDRLTEQVDRLAGEVEKLTGLFVQNNERIGTLVSAIGSYIAAREK